MIIIISLPQKIFSSLTRSWCWTQTWSLLMSARWTYLLLNINIIIVIVLIIFIHSKRGERGGAERMFYDLIWTVVKWFWVRRWRVEPPGASLQKWQSLRSHCLQSLPRQLQSVWKTEEDALRALSVPIYAKYNLRPENISEKFLGECHWSHLWVVPQLTTPTQESHFLRDFCGNRSLNCCTLFLVSPYVSYDTSSAFQLLFGEKEQT